jgi:hypothetical protein
MVVEVYRASDVPPSLADIPNIWTHTEQSLISSRSTKSVSSDPGTFLFLLGVWNKLSCELLPKLPLELRPSAHRFGFQTTTLYLHEYLNLTLILLQLVP